MRCCVHWQNISLFHHGLNPNMSLWDKLGYSEDRNSMPVRMADILTRFSVTFSTQTLLVHDTGVRPVCQSPTAI